MKNRKYFALLCISAVLLTACENSENSQTADLSGSTETVSENSQSETEAETQAETKPGRKVEDECADEVPHLEGFHSFEEFEQYMASGKMNEDFSGFTYAYTGEPVTYDDVKPCIPVFDESKYQLDRIELCNTHYRYVFKNLIEDSYIDLEIDFHTYYHSFEEMAESANANLVLDVENAETTVWGDTPALVQSIQFSDPVEYSVQAMIDENNRVYMSCDGMTPEELTACLNEFAFK